MFAGHFKNKYFEASVIIRVLQNSSGIELFAIIHWVGGGGGVCEALPHF